MPAEDLQERLKFLERAEALKDTLRSGFTAQGRREDTASHSWRLCLWILVFEDHFPELDIAKMLKIALLHDLGEVVSGDIPATEQVGDKSETERADFQYLLQGLSDEQTSRFLELWDDYTNSGTKEATVVKGLDKLETMLQHTQGQNPDDFDYEFNLTYGRKNTDAHPVLSQLRDLIDEKTKSRM